MSGTCDVIVLGAGMAGASLAAELAPVRRVVLVEAEDQPGRHATGRSAAVFFESYGNATVRALTRASRAFLERPPPSFADVPLLAPRAALFVADAGRAAGLDALLAQPDADTGLRRVEATEALRHCPIIRPEWIAGGVLDPSGCDLDVAAIHAGYLRTARRRAAVRAAAPAPHGLAAAAAPGPRPARLADGDRRGYGIQMAPALARAAAALVMERPLSPDVAGQGVTAEMLSPARLPLPAASGATTAGPATAGLPPARC
jgi:glycine/D-amino acid oxidase-like deaminating enzyme